MFEVLDYAIGYLGCVCVCVFTWLIFGLQGWRLTGAAAHVALHVCLACLQFWPLTEITSGSQGHRGCCTAHILSHRLTHLSSLFFYYHSFSLVLILFSSSHISFLSLMPVFFSHFLLRIRSLGKSASVFHNHPLHNILCHGTRFPVFENNPICCIINQERACRSTWRSATPYLLLLPPGGFLIWLPRCTFPSTGNCGKSRGILVLALVDCSICSLCEMFPKCNPIWRCPSGK